MYLLKEAPALKNIISVDVLQMKCFIVVPCPKYQTQACLVSLYLRGGKVQAYFYILDIQYHKCNNL